MKPQAHSLHGTSPNGTSGGGPHIISSTPSGAGVNGAPGSGAPGAGGNSIKEDPTLFQPSCHQNGGFSRCDTYKNHLKAMHFDYPAGTKKRDRNGTPGSCKGCGKEFPDADTWIATHIESGECDGIRRVRALNDMADGIKSEHSPINMFGHSHNGVMHGGSHAPPPPQQTSSSSTNLHHHQHHHHQGIPGTGSSGTGVPGPVPTPGATPDMYGGPGAGSYDKTNNYYARPHAYYEVSM